MKTLAALWVSALMAGCASTPPMPPAATLFHDELFAPASVAIEPEAALAMSPAMRDYLDTKFPHRLGSGDRRRQLVAALYRGDLKLEYDAAMTRTAAQAFEARAGNCLALVMMTAAFAKALGLTVHYQAVIGDDAWDRAGDLYIAIGHVNLVLEDNAPQPGISFTQLPLVVDFLPPADARRLATREIEEPTIVAMYLNNRAVESLTQGQPDDAYRWAREALLQDPGLMAAYITLGVVYRSTHHAALAEQALARVAEREPDNTGALSNRVLALRDLGRTSEAEALAQRLGRLDPHPPFSYFHEGMAAWRAGRVEAARRLFAKEVARAPNRPEFEYWLAVSTMALNDVDGATLHLARAMELSTTRKDRDLYAGKLERLKALRSPQ